MNIFRPFTSIEIGITGSERSVNRALAPLFQDSLCAESARLSVSHRGGEDAARPFAIQQVRVRARPDVSIEEAKEAALSLSLMLQRSVVSLNHGGDTFTICCDVDILKLYHSVHGALFAIRQADQDIQVRRVGWAAGKLKTIAMECV